MTFDVPYKRPDFADFLRKFLPDDFEPCEKSISGNAHILGHSPSLDLDIFEIKHEHSNVARVAISKQAFNLMLNNSYCNKALAVFIPKDDNGQYRFSLLKIKAETNDMTNRVKKSYSDSKRFSFLLGEKAKTKTASMFLKEKVKNFEDLENRFSKEVLTDKFYTEIYDWYLWALSIDNGFKVSYPNKDKEKYPEHLLRLITRLMFVWFIKQKNLVPDDIFDVEKLQNVLNNFDSQSKSNGNYYNAILQNLFFATLNKPILEREFASKGGNSKNEHFGIKTLFRDNKDESFFKIKHSKFIEFFESIPFLNGGLFECLEQDGFSREKNNRAFLPNCLFFEESHKVLLKKYEYNKSWKDKEKEVSGLIKIFEKYNFTVDENDDSDVEISVDPELLGNVFEKLLGVYDFGSKESKRKETGSYYTPKEIVNYMVDEALNSYLKDRGVNDLNTIKILDPACGSGAFPIGILNKLLKEIKPPPEKRYETKKDLIKNCIYGVDIQSIAVQICKLRFFLSLIAEQTKNDDKEKNYGIETLPNLETKFICANTLIGLEKNKDSAVLFNSVDENLIEMKRRLWDIREDKNFSAKTWQEKKSLRERDKNTCREIKDYLRKLCKPDEQKIKEYEGQIEFLQKERKKYIGENWVKTGAGEQMSMFGKAERKTIFDRDVNKEQRDIIDKEIKEYQEKIRNEKNKKLNDSLAKEIEQMTQWDPYNQNAVNSWFDAEWMFGVEQEKQGLNGTSGGFDVVIGNPPYVFARNSKSKGMTDTNKSYFYENYSLAEYQINLYPLFIEKGTNILKNNGILCYITPNNWLTLNTNKQLRQFVLKQSRVSILNFYKRVFKSADVDSVIVSYKKNNEDTVTENIKLAEWEENYSLIGEIEKTKILNSKDFVINIEALKGNEIFSLVEKIENNSVPLATFAKVKCGLGAYGNGDGIPPQTKEMIKNRVYHSKNKKGDDWYKYIEGEDVKRYECSWNKREYLKYGKHLREPRSDWNLFSTPRILVRQIPSQLPYCINACYVEGTFLNDRNSMNIVYIKTSPLYLLGVLNSRLISYWFANKFGKLQRGLFPQFKINELAQFPIPNISPEKQQPIISAVNKILCTKKKNPEADTSELEREVDGLVYELYGLNDEEVKIIEN